MWKFLALALALVSFSACEKLDKLTEFNLPYTTNVTVPSTFGINLPFNIATPGIPTNAQSSFSANGTAGNLIDRINLTQMRLRVTEPSSQTLAFIESVSIYINAEGLGELRIATKDNVPMNTGGELLLDVANEADLKEYLKKDNFNLRLSLVQRQTVSSNVNIEVFSNFFVKGRLI